MAYPFYKCLDPIEPTVSNTLRNQDIRFCHEPKSEADIKNKTRPFKITKRFVCHGMRHVVL